MESYYEAKIISEVGLARCRAVMDSVVQLVIPVSASLFITGTGRQISDYMTSLNMGRRHYFRRDTQELFGIMIRKEKDYLSHVIAQSLPSRLFNPFNKLSKVRQTELLSPVRDLIKEMAAAMDIPDLLPTNPNLKLKYDFPTTDLYPSPKLGLVKTFVYNPKIIQDKLYDAREQMSKLSAEEKKARRESYKKFTVAESWRPFVSGAHLKFVSDESHGIDKMNEILKAAFEHHAPESHDRQLALDHALQDNGFQILPPTPHIEEIQPDGSGYNDQKMRDIMTTLVATRSDGASSYGSPPRNEAVDDLLGSDDDTTAPHSPTTQTKIDLQSLEAEFNLKKITIVAHKCDIPPGFIQPTPTSEIEISVPPAATEEVVTTETVLITESSEDVVNLLSDDNDHDSEEAAGEEADVPDGIDHGPEDAVADEVDANDPVKAQTELKAMGVLDFNLETITTPVPKVSPQRRKPAATVTSGEYEKEQKLLQQKKVVTDQVMREALAKAQASPFPLQPQPSPVTTSSGGSFRLSSNVQPGKRQVAAKSTSNGKKNTTVIPFTIPKPTDKLPDNIMEDDDSPVEIVSPDKLPSAKRKSKMTADAVNAASKKKLKIGVVNEANNNAGASTSSQASDKKKKRSPQAQVDSMVKQVHRNRKQWEILEADKKKQMIEKERKKTEQREKEEKAKRKAKEEKAKKLAKQQEAKKTLQEQGKKEQIQAKVLAQPALSVPLDEILTGLPASEIPPKVDVSTLAKIPKIQNKKQMVVVTTHLATPTTSTSTQSQVSTTPPQLRPHFQQLKAIKMQTPCKDKQDQQNKEDKDDGSDGPSFKKSPRKGASWFFD